MTDARKAASNAEVESAAGVGNAPEVEPLYALSGAAPQAGEDAMPVAWADWRAIDALQKKTAAGSVYLARERSAAYNMPLYTSPVAVPPVEGWRPIETDVPKEPVLVAARWTSPDEGEKWSVGEAYISSHDNEWWWANTSYGDYHAENLPSQGFRVSHWMPLPTPPDSQGGEDA